MGRGLVKKHLFLILLVVLSLSSLSYAEGNWYDNLFVWTGLAVMIAASFLGLAYMAAKLFELQMLEAWVKIELGELGASIIIAVFCIGLIASVDVAAQFYAGQMPGTDVVDIARNSYLRDRLYADGRAIHSVLGEAYFSVAKVASYSYTYGTSVYIASVSYSESPASGLYVLASQIGKAMDSVSNFMLLAAAQAAFLVFFKSAASVMLPVGIVLRSFSLTRKIGGVLLAAVIASSVIYPASFFLSSEVYGQFSPEMMLSVSNLANSMPKAENAPAADVVCDPFMQAFIRSPAPMVGGNLGWGLTICVPLCTISGPGFAACFESCRQLVNFGFMTAEGLFTMGMFPTFLGFAGELGSPAKAEAYFNALYDNALPLVSKYAVLSLVSFLIPVIITLTFLRSLAIAFGGEPQLYGLSKLV